VLDGQYLIRQANDEAYCTLETDIIAAAMACPLYARFDKNQVLW